MGAHHDLLFHKQLLTRSRPFLWRHDRGMFIPSSPPFRPFSDDVDILDLLFARQSQDRAELLYVPPEPGQEYRYNDAIDALWGLFDTLPKGRGDFEAQLKYREWRN